MKFLKTLLPVAAIAAVFAGCQDEDFGVTSQDIKNAKYDQEFKKAFGDVDKDQDWSMAARTTANFNVSGITGNAIVKIYTGNPNNTSNAKLLGCGNIQNGIGSFEFYAVEGMKEVHVIIQQGNKITFSSRCTVEDGNINVGEFATRAFSADNACPTTQRSAEDNGTAVYTYFNKTPGLVANGYTHTWGTSKTLQEWIDWTLDNLGSSTQPPYTGGTIFTDASLLHYQKPVGFDFSNPVLRDGAVENTDGTLTYTNQGKTETHTVAEWETIYRDNQKGSFEGWISGPWVPSSVLVYEDCAAGAEYAVYVGLYPTTQWVVDETKCTPYYPNVQPTFQYLDNVEKAAAPGWNLATGYSFFGDGNFFAESVSVWDSRKMGENAFYTEETMKLMEQGFSILTTANQVIELPFVFGVTAYTNQFGYIYYKEENEANIDPITLKHFVLIEDGRPAKNIYRDTWQTGTAVAGNSNGSLADWYQTYSYTTPDGTTKNINWVGTSADKDKDIICYCSEEGKNGIYSENEEDRKHTSACYSPAEEFALVASKSIIGTSYRPMFFGENGDAATGSYQWPAGYKIIFWINTLAESTTDGDNLVANHPASCFTQQGGHFNYSIPALNHRLYHEYQGTITDGKDVNTFGQVQTISWSIKNSDGTSTTFLAFGDNSGDKDLNDMVFMVSAPNAEDGTVVVAPIKWHLNYNRTHVTTDEDLFDMYSLNVGASYTNPKKMGAQGTAENSEPKRPGYEFLGWSTDPTATTGNKNISATVADEDGLCYYAVWNKLGDETISWIFACEDLGGSFDYDFNDIVWEVSQTVHTDDDGVTYSNVKVTLLASGGVLPVKLLYDGTAIGTGDLHTLFGGAAASDGRYETVNVTPGVTLIPSVEVGEIAGTNTAAMDIAEIQSKLTIEVNGSVISGANYYITAVRQGDKEDVAPQVLVLPSTWCWPTEGTLISDAYPDFTSWVSNTKDADWSSNRVEGKYMAR